MRQGLVVRRVGQLLFVCWAGLMGLSLPVAKPGIFDTPWAFPLTGIAIALVALWLGPRVHERVSLSLPPTQPGQMQGLKVMTCALFVASLGWLLAVFIHQTVGILVAGAGVLAGVVGMLMHLLRMLGSSEA